MGEYERFEIPSQELLTQHPATLAPLSSPRSASLPLCGLTYDGAFEPPLEIQRPRTFRKLSASSINSINETPRQAIAQSRDDISITSYKAFSSRKEGRRTSLQSRLSRFDKTEKFARDDMDFIARNTWSDKKEKLVTEPYNYIASQPGKEFRTLILNAFNAWLDVPPESLAVITKVVRMLHTASLLIDDIQDGSEMRRGKTAAHGVYGVAQTIKAGNYVYFLALKELAKLRNPAAAVDIYTREMLYLHRGQGMDLYWRDNLECPTEDDYLEMVSNKTGGLFRLAVKLMQSESPTSIDCIPLVNLIGPIFQIADDYKNLADLEYSQKKGMAEDLTEGKFSFPVIHSILSHLHGEEVLDILGQKPTDLEVKKRAVGLIKRTGSLEYSRQVVRMLIDRAREVVKEIDHGQGKDHGIQMVLERLSI